MNRIIDSQRLTFRQGNSDKFYEVVLRQDATGHYVDVTYGRIGTSGANDTKTRNPVSLAEAQKVMAKVIAEKQKKGYQPSGQAQNAPTAVTTPAPLPVVRCQLSNPVSADDLERLLDDDDWAAQEKMDGVRMRAIRTNSLWVGMGRRGTRVDLPAATVQALDSAFGVVAGDLDIDGELVGTVYYPFDLIEGGGDNLEQTAFGERERALAKLLTFATPGIRMVRAARTSAEKRALFKKVAEANGEGLILRRLDATYYEGRPNSGGLVLKFKFVETASVLVTEINSKRSVAIAARGPAGQALPVGNVTIPPNAAMPSIGDICEVEYLYYFGPGGSLFQPVYKASRMDIDMPDDVSSLKRKPAAVVEAESAAMASAVRKVALAGGGQVTPVLF